MLSIRQPKMTTQALLSLDLGESSSSDSDFRIEDHDDDDDLSDVSKGDGGNGDDSTDDSTDSTSADDNSDASDNDNCNGGRSRDSTQELCQLLAEDDDNVRTGNQSKDKKHQKNINNTIEQILKKFDGSYSKAAHKNHIKLPTKPICCVCLGDRSDDANEIIECDGCGVSVHEGCYGVSDNVSLSSTNSTCSTEPWFCEACRSGVKDPTCELCPNSGGIFKETDVGKWVHLVCALYIRGVAFGEVDQLSAVTLFEMPYSKWGAKVCSLCENARFARTGVCIECDAGMCKAYFHVTCAQAVGFLTEGQNEDEALDPYYAHCKVHSDKDMLKKRKRNYNMLRLHMQQKHMDAALKNDTDEAQLRNKRKLVKYQVRYQQHKLHKGTPWVPTQKMSRLLTTSASAVKRLLAKAKLMGNDINELEKREAQISILVDIRKRWHIQPAFNIEFIGYYYDRISRLKELKIDVTNMAEQNVQLNKQQDLLRSEYDKKLDDNQQIKEKYDKLLAKINEFQTNIQHFHTKPLMDPANLAQIHAQQQQDILQQQQSQQQQQILLQQKQQQLLSTTTATSRPTSVPTAAALKMGVGFPLSHLSNNNNTARLLSTYATSGKTVTTTLSTPLSSLNDKNLALNLMSNALAHDCGICKRNHDQHLMAKCDICKYFYHLACLNPPLTRPPKKSKLYGWQCSECDKSDEDDSPPQIPKGPRKSRTRFNKDGSILLIADKSTDEEQQQQRQQFSSTTVYKKRDISCESTARSISATKKAKLHKTEVNDQNNGDVNMDSSIPSATIQPVIANLKADESLELLLPTHVVEKNVNTSIGDPLALPQKSLAHDLSSSVITLGEHDTSSVDMKKVARKQKRKDKKNKHNVSSDTSDKSPNKERKHKRKKKQHDHQQINQSYGDEAGIIPKIKIKFKTLPLPGEETPEAQFFYVSADTVRSAEEASRPTSVETIEEQTTISGDVLIPAEPEQLTGVVTSEQIIMPVRQTHAVIKAGPRKYKARKKGKGKYKAAVGVNMSLVDPPPQIPKKQRQPILLVCSVCDDVGSTVNTVTCDECRKHYHFTCLEPPVKKSPKIRGYSWHCADCDPTDEERK